MRFHTIITHESPDLDAIFCCYLLRHYGEKCYNGISQAQIQFCPGGVLPGGKTPEELEKDGTLVVDTGGGRLDTHPDGNTLDKEKLHLSAANLVAMELGVENRPGLVNLLEFVRGQDSAGKSLASRNPVDHLVSLPNLIRGGGIFFGDDYLAMTEYFMQVLSAIEYADESKIYQLAREEASTCIISQTDEIFYVPPVLNFKNILAAYIASKILQKTVLWAPPSSHSEKMWHSLEDFLDSQHLQHNTELKKLLTFFIDLKPDHYLLNSDGELDRTVSLPNILEGFFHLNKKDVEKMSEQAFILLDCIVAYEKDWEAAVEDYQQKRKVFKIGTITFAAIESEYGAVVKVARWQDKADILVYKDSKAGHISISLNKLGKLRNFALYRLAAKMRVAELATSMKETDTPPEDFVKVGELAGWFLHQSQKLLLHGSPKARRAPSCLTFTTITDIIISELSTKEKLPDEFCPPDRCLHHQCLFYAQRLPNCFTHRQKLRSPAGHSGKLFRS